jgi:DNA polymerase III alpha subunit
MTWSEQFRENKKKPQNRKTRRSPPIPVNSTSDIPFEATPAQCYRLTVTIQRICERTTKAGDPCYFLQCRDADELMFSVICWDWQWERLQGETEAGKSVTLDVRVPRDEYTAFTLA